MDIINSIACWEQAKIYTVFFFVRAMVPWPGIKPAPPAVEVQSLNRWTAREVPT